MSELEWSWRAFSNNQCLLQHVPMQGRILSIMLRLWYYPPFKSPMDQNKRRSGRRERHTRDRSSPCNSFQSLDGKICKTSLQHLFYGYICAGSSAVDDMTLPRKLHVTIPPKTSIAIHCSSCSTWGGGGASRSGKTQGSNSTSRK